MKNTNPVFYICRTAYDLITKVIPNVACDICKEWYHNKYIGSEPAFTHAIPIFIRHECIISGFYSFLPLITIAIVSKEPDQELGNQTDELCEKYCTFILTERNMLFY